MRYQDQKVLILGMGLSGCSMALFLAQRGAQLIGYDDRIRDIPYSCKVYSKESDLNIEEFDFIAISPGIKKNHPLYVKAKEKRIPLIGEIELGAREIEATCIGITGTNGKSTVTSLITHVLNSSNRPALAVGNIGVPFTSQIDVAKNKICVIELSSYQTEILSTPFLDCALLLNLTPDHLDRYKTFENYALAKLKIQNGLKVNAPFYVEQSLLGFWKDQFTALNVSIYNDSLDTLINENRHSEEVALFFKSKGELERQNYAAAIKALKFLGLEGIEIMKGIISFKGLPHRCEYVATLNGIHFYNDSKATNIESVQKALGSFNTPLIMIMGGQDKGLDFSTLLPYLKDKVRKIYTLGEVRDKMLHTFGQRFSVTCCSSLENALKWALEESEPGDTVLLSPACASFDMFQNFEHRGNEFKRIVNKLKGEEE